MAGESVPGAAPETAVVPTTIVAEPVQAAVAPPAAEPSIAAPAAPLPQAASPTAQSQEAKSAAPEPAPKAEAQPEEVPAPEEAKSVEAAETKPAAHTYTDFTFPEGVSVAPEQIAAFHNILSKNNLSQEAGQELVDFHLSRIKDAQTALVQQQQDVFQKTRQGWVKSFDKEAGNRRDTILNDARWAIGDLVKSKARRAALWNVLSFTGAGDNKELIYAFAAAAQRLREREAPAPGVRHAGKSGPAWDRRYGEKQT